MEYKVDLQEILKDDQTCSASHMDVIDSQPLLVKSQEDPTTELLEVNVEIPCDSSRDEVCIKEEVQEDAELLELVEYNIEISKIIEAPSGNNKKLPIGDQISFECKICHYTTVDRAKLKQHMHIHKKLYKCNICDYSTIRKYNLEEHIQIHTGGKPYKCKFCECAGKNLPSWNQHRLRHASKKKLFQCNLCDYSSAREIYLNLHMSKHNGEKPYKCKLCDFSSTRSHLLKQHMYMHTCEKPFICNVCDHSCECLDSLKLHMLTHTEMKLYKCKVCDNSNSDLETLTLHTRTHSGERSFKCTLCDYSCVREFGFKLHMRTHTSEMQSL